MRILTVLTYYHPHWTGLTAFARRIAEGVAARGHDVTVLTTRHDPALAADEVVGGVRVVRVDPVARVSRAMLAPRLLSSARRLIAEHDLVHVHTPAPELLPVAVLARRAGRPLAITHQGDVVMPAGLRNRLVQGGMTVTMDLAFGMAAGISTHNADYAQHSRFLAAHLPRLRAIHPPVDTPLPDPAAVQTWRAELGLTGRPVIGFAGRFVEEKGFDVLLAAMPAVAAGAPDVRFAFAGERNVVYERTFEHLRDRWEAQRARIVDFGLLLDPHRFADFYALCDVFAVPSRSDCFASVQVESLRSGTPLVASDIPGLRTVVRSTGMGRLVPTGDPGALAAALLAELAARRPRPTVAEVEAVFDPVRAIDEYEEWLASMVGPARPARPAPPTGPEPALAPADAALVERMTNNETDMAYHRRVPALMAALDLADGDALLDCGSGMGVLANVATRLRRVDAVALDTDLERLRWAAREGVAAGLVAGDLYALPFPDACFDKALMSEVLEHLADEDAALAEVRRVLRPGGRVAVSVPHVNYPFWWDPINKSRETFGWPPLTSAGPITGQWSQHVRLYSPPQLRDVVERAGFAVERIAELTHHTFPFNHVLVYSVGKPLIEHDLLPRRLRRAADRFTAEDNPASPWNPVNAVARALRYVDRRNDRPDPDDRSFVSIVATLRRP